MTVPPTEREARARIMWGDTPESVRAFLQENGVGEPEAAALVAGFEEERAAAVRSSGLKKVLLGMLVILAPGAAYVLTAVTRVLSFNLAGWAIFIGLVGLWKLADGVWMLLRPRSIGGELAHLE